MRYNRPKRKLFVYGIRTIAKASTSGTFDLTNADISPSEWKRGCRFGIDSHADTTCLNKHAHIECTHHGQTVDAVPFNNNNKKLFNSYISHPIRVQ
jgi:hypothetical protein